MKHRKLRIAWSVAWGLAAALLILLWVRSYVTLDVVRLRGFNTVASLSGSIRINENIAVIFSRHGMKPNLNVPDIISSYSLSETVFESCAIGFRIPYWPLVITFVPVATLPWRPLRYGLRTLLIATTLVAIVLGLRAWFAH